MPISARIEDYLEALLGMEMRGEELTVTGLSRELEVRKATVVSAVRKLVEGGFLDHPPYGDLEFTETGRERALKIFRRHHLLAFLFREIMGFENGKALEVACATEHFLDPASEQNLSSFVDFYCRSLREEEGWIRRLGASMECPGELPRPLLMLRPGEAARIVRLTADSPLQKRLRETGLLPGRQICMTESPSRGNDLIHLDLEGQALDLQRHEAVAIWVSRRGNC